MGHDPATAQDITFVYFALMLDRGSEIGDRDGDGSDANSYSGSERKTINIFAAG